MVGSITIGLGTGRNAERLCRGPLQWMVARADQAHSVIVSDSKHSGLFLISKLWQNQRKK